VPWVWGMGIGMVMERALGWGDADAMAA